MSASLLESKVSDELFYAGKDYARLVSDPPRVSIFAHCTTSIGRASCPC